MSSPNGNFAHFPRLLNSQHVRRESHLPFLHIVTSPGSLATTFRLVIETAEADIDLSDDVFEIVVPPADLPLEFRIQVGVSSPTSFPAAHWSLHMTKPILLPSNCETSMPTGWRSELRVAVGDETGHDLSKYLQIEPWA